jgi:hypothetical protein
MARRKLTIQRSLGVKESSAAGEESGSIIDKLTEGMSTSEVGFRPTSQRVYEVNLERIRPDFTQPRRLLPHDLREAVQSLELSPADAMQELVLRAEAGDTVALLILGGRETGPAGEEDTVIEDSGLLALAQSIREVGLRHPLNVYRINDPEQSDQIRYRLGEGERRFWAHHLLVQQGHKDFLRVKCIVEPLPENEEVIHQRQEAENAARVDLPAIARARSMERIRARLTVEMGTRVPGENTIKLPSQRELQTAVGQQVKVFTGRAIGDRMVRNYLALLSLPAAAQDLSEAAQLTEKQLRPVMRLKSDDERLAMVKRIVEENWSSRQVFQEVAAPAKPVSTLREVKQRSVEERFEKRVVDAAKTMHTLLELPQEKYEETILSLARRAEDDRMRHALQSLRQTLERILLRVEGLSSVQPVAVKLTSVIPPLEALKRHLPDGYVQTLERRPLTGSQVLDMLLTWQEEDVVVASRLAEFFNQTESLTEALRAGEYVEPVTVEGERSPQYPDAVVYHVLSGTTTYWAHELLVRRGEEQFRTMLAHVVSIDDVPDEDD